MTQGSPVDADRGIEPVDENDTVAVPRVLLKTLYDLAVGSLDFGSGFWDEEDQTAAARVGALLGIVVDQAEADVYIAKHGGSVSAAANSIVRFGRRCRCGHIAEAHRALDHVYRGCDWIGGCSCTQYDPAKG